MILMDLPEQYEQVRQHVAKIKFSETTSGQIPFFETVIRYLGGLLTAFSLTSDRVFLSAADDLARELLPAFDTPSHLPAFGVGLTNPRGPVGGWSLGSAILAEIGSFQLEFKTLAHLTQRLEYFQKVRKNFVDKCRVLTKPEG